MSLLVLAPAMVLAVVAVVAGLRRPPLLLVAYAAVVPYGSGVSLPLGLPPAFTSLSTLAGAAALVGITAHLAISARWARRLVPAWPLWLLFLGWAALTSAWSLQPGATRAELIVLASLVALYATATLLDVRPRDLTLLEHGIVAGGAIAAVLGMVLFAQQGSTGAAVPRLELPAGGGEAGDPNITAAILLLPLVVAAGRGLHMPWGPQRLAYLGAGALTASAIVLTGSRGGLVAAIVALVIVAGTADRRGPALAGAAVAAVGAFMVMVATGPEQLEERLQEVDSTGRTDIWRIGLAACPEHCLLGSGWGTFPEVHERAMLTKPEARGRLLRFGPHSIYVGTLVEGGIVAFGVLVAGLAVTAAGLASVPRALRGPPLAALAGLLVTNTFLDNLAFKYFWLVLIYASLAWLAYRATPARPGRPRAGQRAPAEGGARV